MKVLIVNASDVTGGAARAALRLHEGLLAIGVESTMLVKNRREIGRHVSGPMTKVGRAYSLARSVVDGFPITRYRSRGATLFSPAWLPSMATVAAINKSDADVVHLHWINDGMLSVGDLVRIRKPIVWSMHDMWPFTGGCHYDEDDGRYRNECGNCRVLGSNSAHDLSRRIFNRKKRAYARLRNIKYVGLSNWIAQAAMDSALLRGADIVSIPNPIDVESFRPLERSAARDVFGLPKDKRLILFGAMNVANDPRKGGAELLAALQQVSLNGAELVVFGHSSGQLPTVGGVPTHSVGNLYDDVSLRALYSSVDVLMAPSLQENLSNVMMESLACGTPVVAFRIGGNPDLVDHEVNGFLAAPRSVAGLAEGLEWVLRHPAPETLRAAARQKVKDCFESSLVSRRYLEIYRELLGR